MPTLEPFSTKRGNLTLRSLRQQSHLNAKICRTASGSALPGCRVTERTRKRQGSGTKCAAHAEPHKYNKTYGACPETHLCNTNEPFYLYPGKCWNYLKKDFRIKTGGLTKVSLRNEFTFTKILKQKASTTCLQLQTDFPSHHLANFRLTLGFYKFSKLYLTKFLPEKKKHQKQKLDKKQKEIYKLHYGHTQRTNTLCQQGTTQPFKSILKKKT
ncbi:uncharacterized protein LOC125486363 [Rhincodon typus]|uniref:uncharacterized protein LOC125486363 n=1 Tax=Rhincodon typus TaxID=259920 RepID=UPI00202DD121|nr:uncharacterized protein LOC125486363 [Rhincodon typus]